MSGKTIPIQVLFQDFETGLQPTGWYPWGGNPNPPWPLSWNWRQAPLAGNVSAAFSGEASLGLALGSVWFAGGTFGSKSVSYSSAVISFLFKMEEPTTMTSPGTEIIDLLNWPNELAQVYVDGNGIVTLHAGLDYKIPAPLPQNTTVKIWVRFQVVPSSTGSTVSVAWDLGNVEPTSGAQYVQGTNGVNQPFDSFLLGPTDTDTTSSPHPLWIFDNVELTVMTPRQKK